MPAATGIHVTVNSVVQVPICRPSGEQTDWPGVVQEPVEGLVDAVPELAVVAFELDELSAGARAEKAAEGEAAATEGETVIAGAAADIEDAVLGAAAAGDDEAVASPESPELSVLEP